MFNQIPSPNMFMGGIYPNIPNQNDNNTINELNKKIKELENRIINIEKRLNIYNSKTEYDYQNSMYMM